MRKLILLVLLFCSLPVLACTTFILESGNRVYLGRNLDWDWEDGMVFVNPKNVSKRAFVSSTNAAAWTSKYGSVTFNQFGREMPFGGMNEAGLVVENMWLDDTKYPAADERPEINMLQWIQYQLDNFSSVDDVIGSDKKIRLENTPVRARIHYFVCDARGNSATIEFLKGEMRVHRGRDLRYRALANDTYAKSAAILSTNSALGDLSKPLARKDSIARFCRAAARAEAYNGAREKGQDVRYAFETLNEVRQGDYTVWQIVYDVADRQIHFRTKSNVLNRLIDFKTLNFDCDRPIQATDIQSKPGEFGTLEFKDLPDTEHHQYLQKFFSQDSLKQRVGDLTPMVEPLAYVLKSYSCEGKSTR